MFRESGLFARTVARQAPEDPEEKQIVGEDGNRRANQPPRRFQPLNAVQVQGANNHLLRRTGNRGDRKRHNQRNQQTNQRNKITQIFYPELLLILRRAFPDIA